VLLRFGDYRTGKARIGHGGLLVGGIRPLSPTWSGRCRRTEAPEYGPQADRALRRRSLRRRACVVPPRHRSPTTRSPRPACPQADRALRRRPLRRRACVVPPRHRSPTTRPPRPARPQADRALRRPSLVGAHAWSRLGTARLRLARPARPGLRRTARCADCLSSARMRGPASAPLALDPSRFGSASTSRFLGLSHLPSPSLFPCTHLLHFEPRGSRTAGPAACPLKKNSG